MPTHQALSLDMVERVSVKTWKLEPVQLMLTTSTLWLQPGTKASQAMAPMRMLQATNLFFNMRARLTCSTRMTRTIG